MISESMTAEMVAQTVAQYLSPDLLREYLDATFVQRRLAPLQLDRFALRVDPDAVRKEDDWWYVTVYPEPSHVPSHVYSELLTDIEERIKEAESLNVLLVPTLARN